MVSWQEHCSFSCDPPYFPQQQKTILLWSGCGWFNLNGVGGLSCAASLNIHVYSMSALQVVTIRWGHYLWTICEKIRKKYEVEYTSLLNRVLTYPPTNDYCLFLINMEKMRPLMARDHTWHPGKIVMTGFSQYDKQWTVRVYINQEMI